MLLRRAWSGWAAAGGWRAVHVVLYATWLALGACSADKPAGHHDAALPPSNHSDDAGDARDAGHTVQRDGAVLTDGAPPADAALDARVMPSDASMDMDAQPPPVTGKSKRAACRAYVGAFCQQRYACSGPSARSDCQSMLDACPDILFSPGSSYTPDVLLSCADDWTSMTCSEFMLGKTPSCTRPGTRAVGESCISASQCKTSRCTGSLSRCGTCADVVSIGGACSAPMCEAGATCTSGTCTATSTSYAKVPRGEPCVSNRDACQTDYVCAPDATSATGSRCLLAEAGLPCYAGHCAASAYCPRTGGSEILCVALPKVGEPCADAKESGAPSCEASAYCDQKTCKARLPLGSGCTADPCVAGLECAEPNPQGFSTCLHFGDEGDSCSGTYERCVFGTECVAGKCQARDSLGVFATTCK